MNTLALNHRVAPKLGIAPFFALAAALEVTDVEIRNDLPGLPIADGMPAELVGRLAHERGLTILSINALYPFNIWTNERAQQARAIIDYARRCGAAGIVMCPLNDAAYKPTTADRLAALREALTQLAPMLRDANIIGLVEPLGFAECSLRLKREAVDAIEDTTTADVFKLVHDTFHHHVAGESELFPQWTGLVHVSGVDDPRLAATEMRDPHRVLVTEKDQLDNIGQVRALAQGGYAGPLSFEPFADSVSDAPDIHAALASSFAFIAKAYSKPA